MARKGLPRPGLGDSEPQPARPASEPDVVDLDTEAPGRNAKGATPRRQRPVSRAARAAVVAGALIILAAIVVLTARGLLGVGAVQHFLASYPGETDLPESAPLGLPAWVGWQHFFNVFLVVLIVKTGWQVRTQRRPPATWTSRRKPGRGSISLTLWLHQSLDLLWLFNGVIFVVLLFSTGQWMRVVPTSFDVFPNALSAALQYASLNWPTENGWVNYNSLQVVTYFVTVFIAAPLAITSGIRMSKLWPASATALSRAFPVEFARAIHLPVMLYFVAFTIVHVTLVLATGALRNLNHMYGNQDAVNWWGFGVFALSLVVMTAAWFAARPVVVAPIARVFGKVGR